ncbi:MAG: LPS assembly protein LptD [Methylococcaceae bacterium]
MYRQLFCIFFLFSYLELGFANDNDWNCKDQGKEGWACGDLTAQKSTDNSSLPVPSKANKTISDLEQSSQKESPISNKPPQVTSKNSGWNCYTGGENGTWNCSLKGADPKGQTKFVEDKTGSFSLFSDAFDLNQEQQFKMLQSNLKYDPWENCSNASRGKYRYVQGEDTRDTVPMNVTADYTEVFDKEITSFFGNVEIVRADQKVSSDSASYDTVSETMDAQGQVLYSENEISLFSDTVLLNLKSNEARLRDAIFISPSGPIRGHADVVYRDNKFLSRYKNAAFTSCRPGNQDWVLHTDRLKMNKQTGKGSAKHAWLEFKSVPLLYTPYISFPIDDRRTTGILAPSFGSADENGFDISLPYYWNIAPNYDLLLRPRYMSKRGVMIGAEFRYLTEKTNGLIGLEYLPYDILEQKQRYSGTFKNRTVFIPGLDSNIDLNYVSDDEYFDELNNALGMSNDRFLQSQANLNYRREGVFFTTHFESYQTIDKNVIEVDKPYQKLPQVILNFDHSFEDWPVDIAMDNEYVNFHRNSRVSGHRINVKPSIAIPIKTAGYFFKPKFSWQHSEYFLNNQIDGKSSSISRSLPIFSTDSGLIFERDFEFENSSYLNTLEPRLFYLYIPNKNQDDIPVFDSSLYDFSFSSLFRENRFSGNDRVQDANQITAALTSRLIDSKTGQERLKFSVGEIFYFKDREVVIKGTPERQSFSNPIAALSGQLTKQLSFSSDIHWDLEEDDIARGHVQLTYRNQPSQIFNLGYRYRGEDQRSAIKSISRIDTSIRWPILDNWYGVGRLQYSFNYQSTTESFVGLEKDSCCWRFRIIWRRFANTLKDSLTNDFVLDENNEIEMDEGIFVQMELKGLTSFGDKVDEFLEKNLSGYQSQD